jgi:DNA invertase Pin-like site-specific DNA recombinase
MMLQLLGCFAEFERSVILERTSAGIVSAKAKGVRFGRPRKIDVDALPGMRAQGLNARQIAEYFDCDTSSVTTWLLKLGINPRGGVSAALKLPRYRLAP